jgi:Domain of unknown function (DUF5666)
MSEPGVPPHISQQPDQILEKPIVMGDLDAELKQNKRSVGKVTLGLGAAVLLVAAFFGGVATHAAIAKPAAQPTAQQGPGGGRFPGGYQGGGQNGQGGQGFRGGTIGTIEKIDGTTITVKTPDGREVKVSTSDSTQVRVTQEGKLTDLKQGQTVAVQGSTGSDGSVSAQTITQQPARTNG